MPVVYSVNWPFKYSKGRIRINTTAITCSLDGIELRRSIIRALIKCYVIFPVAFKKFFLLEIPIKRLDVC